MEEWYPGRVYLGVGSGESVNESPLGLDWPDTDEQHDRFAADLGASVICLQLIGQADPEGTIALNGDRVLPALRGVSV